MAIDNFFKEDHNILRLQPQAFVNIKIKHDILIQCLGICFGVEKLQLYQEV